MAHHQRALEARQQISLLANNNTQLQGELENFKNTVLPGIQREKQLVLEENKKLQYQFEDQKSINSRL